ncbi:hypothetical protein EO244_03735 [Ancylomarina salipaludis]|uniref:Uncharacterized protein n=1 Tax=Ancylomarina salipaludis TaxID=2501299 RepID=A0A4Q1JPJ5_9BACT|nr:lipid-binding protein [Ancylomarina salipaludis]RXQ96752.1 hypothetical protein EO244_03735 [Ancylomarina salipaludis]
MKNIINKLFLVASVIIVGLSFTSCDEKIEIWDSATLEYSGTYVYELKNEDATATYVGYSDQNKIEIFNTSANVENEVIIYDHGKMFPLKSKFIFSGNATSFASKSLLFDDLTNNEEAVVLPEDAPTAITDTLSEDRDYLRAAVVEGSIIKDGMTTIGGNVADSLYFKIVLYSGTANFKSVAVPVEYRANPDKEEFEWELVSVVRDAAKDKTYVISGHRYTGFSEDSH